MLFLFPLQSCSPLGVKSGDRFIPTRAGSNWSINFHYANVSHVLYSSLHFFPPQNGTSLTYLLIFCRKTAGRPTRISARRTPAQTPGRVKFMFSRFIRTFLCIKSRLGNACSAIRRLLEMPIVCRRISIQTQWPTPPCCGTSSWERASRPSPTLTQTTGGMPSSRRTLTASSE